MLSAGGQEVSRLQEPLRLSGAADRDGLYHAGCHVASGSLAADIGHR